MIQPIVRRLSCKLAVFCASLGVLCTPLAAFAQSINLTQNQLDSIKLNCKNAQQTMIQLEKNDEVARINRGRDYDLMLNQISAFNSRLAYNKINQPQFVQIASDMQTQVDNFRSSYATYDDALSSAINADCRNQSTDFYNLIVTVRQDRQAVGAIVTQIEQLQSQYRDQLVQYEASLPVNGGGQ